MEPARAALRLPLAVLWLVLATGCWQQRVWSRADEFVGRLRCGMSQAEAEQVASKYPGLKLEVVEPQGRGLVFWKDNTMIEMKLEKNGLGSVQVSWIDTIMHVRKFPERDLCAAPMKQEPK